MPLFTVVIKPRNVRVEVKEGTTLLEAVSKAGIIINNLCAGDGICGHCRMIVLKGKVEGGVSPKLTREEIKKGYVLGCMAYIKSDIVLMIPDETLAKEKYKLKKDAERFSSFRQISAFKGMKLSPLVQKIYIELNKPSLADNASDHQRVCDAVRQRVESGGMQMGLKVISRLPGLLKENDFRITATVGLRRDIAEIMDIEGGDTSGLNYMVVVDIGTTTVIAHLVNIDSAETLDARACFNSQGIYGREVTGRIISAERKGTQELQKLIIEDINSLIEELVRRTDIRIKDITAVVCAGNTAMAHFLLGMPTENIRRSPYNPASVTPPPFRAAEVGIEINPRGLLYSLPGLSGWVGSDITAGILTTGMYETDQLSLLVDIGTNGEIVIGNKDWLVSTSASAGPALEGANEACGMRAEEGAVEKVFVRDGRIEYEIIGNTKPKGICGSGIIDIVSVLLDEGILNRSGRFVDGSSERVERKSGVGRYLVTGKDQSGTGNPIYLSESDIENIISAKAAIFAAVKIILDRLDLGFDDIEHFYIAGGFGRYINVDNAINIGLIPDLPRECIEYVGNTSIQGAKTAAVYKDAFFMIEEIRQKTTYYDLMGANDYIDEFRKALFLPHTDIELFRRSNEKNNSRRG